MLKIIFFWKIILAHILLKIIFFAEDCYLHISLTGDYTRIEPAGAGGATGASHQLRRHQLGRGGRWRRSRHLRRVQRPRQAGCGTKMGEFGVATVARTAFLSALFMKLQLNCSNWSKKRPKKTVNKHADTQTNRQNPADPEQLRGRVLDSQNADTSRKCLKNLSPKRPLNPANIPVKEHLRLASVVALSSNGACGAIILKIRLCHKRHADSQRHENFLSEDVSFGNHSALSGDNPKTA